MKRGFLLLFVISVIHAYGQTDTTKVIYKIGDHFGGGIIFYLDETGQHGKIVTEINLSSKLRYGCPDMFVYSDSPFDGEINTILITKNCGEETAASVCSGLSLGGYDNWYLPSIFELELVYKTLFNKLHFSTGYYWSSTECKECNFPRSWGMKFDNQGKKVTIDRSRTLYVRGIRKF